MPPCLREYISFNLQSFNAVQLLFIIRGPFLDYAYLMYLVTHRSRSVDSWKRLNSRRIRLWFAGWLGPCQTRKWRTKRPSRDTFGIYRGACQPHAIVREPTATYTRAATQRTESWRPCLCPCRLSRTAFRRRISSVMSYRVYTTGRSDLACGNGISVQLHMESVNYCHSNPEPKPTQHPCAAAPQTARTLQRGCGLFTMRPKGRLKVW